jgi:hypothetical protein
MCLYYALLLLRVDETMPIAELPSTAVYEGVVVISGIQCNHWIQDDATTEVDIYADIETGMPRGATETFVMNTGQLVPMITYEFHNVTLGPQVSSSSLMCMTLQLLAIDSALRRELLSNAARNRQ